MKIKKYKLRESLGSLFCIGFAVGFLWIGRLEAAASFLAANFVIAALGGRHQ